MGKSICSMSYSRPRGLQRIATDAITVGKAAKLPANDTIRSRKQAAQERQPLHRWWLWWRWWLWPRLQVTLGTVAPHSQTQPRGRGPHGAERDVLRAARLRRRLGHRRGALRLPDGPRVHPRWRQGWATAVLAKAQGAKVWKRPP